MKKESKNAQCMNLGEGENVGSALKFQAKVSVTDVTRT